MREKILSLIYSAAFNFWPCRSNSGLIIYSSNKHCVQCTFYCYSSNAKFSGSLFFLGGEEERGTLQHQVTTVFKCKIRKNKSLLSKVFFEMCNPHAHPISIHDFSHPQTRIILASSSQTSEKHPEVTHTLNQRSKNCSSTSFPFSFKHKVPCV